MISSEELVRLILQLINENKKISNKLGKVTNVSGGKTYIQFDGEDAPSMKGYMKLSSYSPVVGDRVILIKCNGTYIIHGKIG